VRFTLIFVALMYADDTTVSQLRDGAVWKTVEKYLGELREELVRLTQLRDTQDVMDKRTKGKQDHLASVAQERER
jgi:hypothetical protein